MADMKLVVARASLQSNLMRATPNPVPKVELDHFLSKLLDTAVEQCTPSNIQNCTRWLLENSIYVPGRVSAFEKYLTALSSSFDDPKTRKSRVSSNRKRLHILYLLHDLLHHTKYHLGDDNAHRTFLDGFQHFWVRFVTRTATSEPERHKQLHKRLEDLFKIWETEAFFSLEFVNTIRQAIGKSKLEAVGNQETPEDVVVDKSVATKETPYIMPRTHGDPSTPWYDLPAANLIPQIPHRWNISIGTRKLKAMEFSEQPAELKLVDAIQELLRDAERIYKNQIFDDEGIVVDIDRIGQPILRDKETGKSRPGDTYYGWSQEFSEKMKNKKIRRGAGTYFERDSSRSRERTDRGRRSSRSSEERHRGESYSSNEDRPSKRARRDLSASSAGSAGERKDYRSRFRSRSCSHSRSRHHSSYSRSPSPGRYRQRDYSPSHGDGSTLRARQLSRGRPAQKGSRSRSTGLSRSPMRRSHGHHSDSNVQQLMSSTPAPNGLVGHQGFMPPSLFQQPPLQGQPNVPFPMGPMHIPPPPPPPPIGYIGAWPPLPAPPTMPYGVPSTGQQPSYAPWQKYSHPPPPGQPGLPFQAPPNQELHSQHPPGYGGQNNAGKQNFYGGGNPTNYYQQDRGNGWGRN